MAGLRGFGKNGCGLPLTHNREPVPTATQMPWWHGHCLHLNNNA
jgi:hypothetical protein